MSDPFYSWLKGRIHQARQDKSEVMLAYLRVVAEKYVEFRPKKELTIVPLEELEDD
jgi:hypothetical protein